MLLKIRRALDRFSNYLVKGDLNQTLYIVSFTSLVLGVLLCFILVVLGRLEIDIPQGASATRRATIWQVILFRNSKQKN